MNGFSWDNVRLLLTLLRLGSVEEAAAQLGIDRSTVTRRLSAVEAELGVTLFARTRDGLKALPAALRLGTLGETMEQAAAELSDAAARTDARIAGTVRLATTEAMAALLIGEGLLALNDQHPDSHSRDRRW